MPTPPKPLVAFDPLLRLGVRLNQARVDCEPFATDQPLPDAAAQDDLEHATEEIALTEATVPVLRERRVIGDSPVQTQPAKPTVRQIEVDFIADSPANPTAQWDRNLSPVKVSPKREFPRFRLETFGIFSPELPFSRTWRLAASARKARKMQGFRS